MAEYLTYPFKTMRITQSYTGTTSHLPHTTGSPKDYPIDEGGKDGGRDPFYARCKMKVRKIYGVGNRGTNTLWIESTEKVLIPNGKLDYVTIMIIHPNDSDIGDLKVGQTFKKNDIVCYEGMDGATGNHIHMAVGMGKMTGGGWTQNSKGKWVLTTEHGTIKPEEAFYIDKSFTNVINSKGLKFKELPKDNPTASKTQETKKEDKNSFLPSRGYFKKGDVSPNVGKIAKFMRDKFPAYTSEKALGNTYGDNLIKAVKEFQKRTGLTADGYFGEKTLKKLTEYGFKY